MDVMRHVVEA